MSVLEMRVILLTISLIKIEIFDEIIIHIK